MTSATFIPARYRVRQTFFSFGAECEETFSTIGEAEAYGRAIAEDLAQTFFQTSDDYVDVPYRSPFNAIGYSNEVAFFASLCQDCGVDEEGGSERPLQVRGKIKWSELGDRILKAAIEIETVRLRDE
jgi:hypothetical protein